MSNQKIFNFEGHELRNVDENGEAWTVANDICHALGYANPHEALARHVDVDDIHKRLVVDAMGRKQLTNTLNDSGLFSLVFGSKMPKAKIFRRWVTSEVLPQICNVKTDHFAGLSISVEGKK